jgi:hypothetical protein
LRSGLKVPPPVVPAITVTVVNPVHTKDFLMEPKTSWILPPSNAPDGIESFATLLRGPLHSPNLLEVVKVDDRDLSLRQR